LGSHSSKLLVEEKRDFQLMNLPQTRRKISSDLVPAKKPTRHRGAFCSVNEQCQPLINILILELPTYYIDYFLFLIRPKIDSNVFEKPLSV
jgi:hypothetical protein